MFLDVLLPERCGSCGARGPSPCADCWRRFLPAPRVPTPAGLQSLHAPLAYEGAARELVARLKYRNDRSSVAWLAGAMASALPVDSAARAPSAVVSWAPTTPRRRRERGFDHAELLARELADRLGLSSRALLRRHDGVAQTGLSPLQRRANRPSFLTRGRPPAVVLLVDDVVTTGTTLAAAAQALRGAGATSVTGVAAAITPLKR